MHCEREMGKEPNDQLRIALHKMIFIDLYVRNYWRGKAVRALVNAGIPVHVVGKGWEELERCETSGVPEAALADRFRYLPQMLARTRRCL